MSIVHRHQRRTASGKTTTVRQHHRDTGDGDLRPAREDLGPPPMVGGEEKFLLTVRSRSGRRVNAVTGAPEDTVMVHSREDLDRRLAAAAQDPDYEVSYEPASVPPAPADSGAESWWDEDEAGGDAPWLADDEPEHDVRASDPRAGKRAAVERYRGAKDALRANQEYEVAHGIDEETPEFLRLNHEYNEAMRDVPWWRR